MNGYKLLYHVRSILKHPPRDLITHTSNKWLL